MTQNCAYCQCPFETTGKRQTCSQRCAGYLSRQNAGKKLYNLDGCRTGRLSASHPHVSNLPKADTTRSELPPVETLPAAYVKRVHDLWESLTGDAPTRIA